MATINLVRGMAAIRRWDTSMSAQRTATMTALIAQATAIAPRPTAAPHQHLRVRKPPSRPRVLTGVDPWRGAGFYPHGVEPTSEAEKVERKA